MKARLYLLCLALSACSWIVDPEDRPARCEPAADGTDACGAGFLCVEGACVEKCVLIEGEEDPCPDGKTCNAGVCSAPCVPNTEVCKDKVDNDCDGKVDEQDVGGRDRCGDFIDNDCDDKVDEGGDGDMDGATWCGDLEMPKGGPLVDCDDGNRDVSPLNSEVCDGIDNDCDNITDETSDKKALCPAGQMCIGRCVTPSCAIPGSSDPCGDDEMCNVITGECGPKLCDPAECNGPGEYCDQTSGECRTERRNNGDTCAAHSDCKSLSCIESAALNLTVVSERVCGQTCCYDQDCPDGERCFTAGTGARSCLPASRVPLPEGASPMCTLDSQCGAGEACAVLPNQTISGTIVSTRRDLIATVCRDTDGGDAETGEACSSSNDCASNACILGSGGIFFPTSLCSQACRTSEDCQAVQNSPYNSLDRPSYCRFVAPTSQFGSEGDYVPICVVGGSEIGAGLPGAPCTSGPRCQEGGCVGAGPNVEGRCASTCCNDSQCSAWGEVFTKCRPVKLGDHYETRCVP